jgi:hypothetical protein
MPCCLDGFKIRLFKLIHACQCIFLNFHDGYQHSACINVDGEVNENFMKNRSKTLTRWLHHISELKVVYNVVLSLTFVVTIYVCLAMGADKFSMLCHTHFEIIYYVKIDTYESW